MYHGFDRTKSKSTLFQLESDFIKAGMAIVNSCIVLYMNCLIFQSSQK